MPRSYTKLDDEDVGSLHFGDKTVEGSEKELTPQGEKKGKRLKKKLIRHIVWKTFSTIVFMCLFDLWMKIVYNRFAFAVAAGHIIFLEMNEIVKHRPFIHR